MKRNRTPASERLKRRILKLQDRWEATRRTNDHGERCVTCGRVDMYGDVEADQWDIDGHPHRKTCSAKGLPAEIAHYQRLLTSVLPV